MPRSGNFIKLDHIEELKRMGFSDWEISGLLGLHVL